MNELPESINPGLWIVWGDPPSRLYLMGSSHTFPGRMAAYHPEGWSVSVSKFEIEEAGELAWAWIDGFLCGAEPEPPDGQDEVATADWQRTVEVFRSSGDMPRG